MDSIVLETAARTLPRPTTVISLMLVDHDHHLLLRLAIGGGHHHPVASTCSATLGRALGDIMHLRPNIVEGALMLARAHSGIVGPNHGMGGWV